MTALVLPKLWLPRFEPWRLLKPLKIDGQFHPGQAIQFIDNEPGVTAFKAGGGPITIIDDGSVNSNNGTYSSQTSTGPDTIVLLSQRVNDGVTVTGATFNGNSMSILHQQTRAAPSEDLLAAILYINGAQSGDVVVSFSGGNQEGRITVASLTNLQSSTPVDTDDETASDGSADLDTLSSPGAGGIRLAAWTSYANGTDPSWSNAVELDDAAQGDIRASSAYDLGDDAAAIAANGGSNDEVIVGVSLR